MNPENKPRYSAEDLRRYHSGELSPAERHALERAALEDPLLADALEGYAYTSTSEADLAAIREKLSKKKKQRGFPWLMRAAVMVLAVAGLLFLVINNDKPQTETAIQTDIPTQPSSSPRLVEDSSVRSISEGSYATTDAAPEQEKSTVSPAGVSKRREADETSGTVAQAPVIVTSPQQTMANTTYDSQMVAGADAMETRAGSRSLRSSRADTVRDLNIVLQEDQKATSEVVVTNLGGKPRAYAPPDPRFDVLEPTQGWGSYNEYLAANIQTPDQTKARFMQKRGASREVELQFDTNSLGEPQNIKVTSSLGSSYDKEAVRLLEKGPKWPGGLRERKIRIRF
jgi:hypothetical protein